MIGIIDYGMGNLKSLYNAIEYLGFEAKLICEPNHLDEFDRLILPGVGAYRRAMENLCRKKFPAGIRNYVSNKKPLMGICLGMQLLSTNGNEPEPCDGLNLILFGSLNQKQQQFGCCRGEWVVKSNAFHMPYLSIFYETKRSHAARVAWRRK